MNNITLKKKCKTIETQHGIRKATKQERQFLEIVLKSVLVLLKSGNDEQEMLDTTEYIMVETINDVDVEKMIERIRTA